MNQTIVNNVPRFLLIILLVFFNCSRSDQTHQSHPNFEKDTIENTNPAPGKTISGTIFKVHDGDTYDVRLINGDTIRIRMEGVDAPEGGMAYYRVSKKYLNEMAYGEEVEIKINEKDGNNRYVGLTYLGDGRELSYEMLKAGLAWHYKEFNSYPEFAAMEEEARLEERGLWEEDNPVPPWIHRRLRRRGFATKDLNPYRKRVFEVSEKNLTYYSDGLELKVSKDSKSQKYHIQILKNGKSIQRIETDYSNDFRITLADYDMDGHPDIKIGDDESGYFLFDNAKNLFVEREDWKLKVWKLDKPEKHILTMPVEGNPYSGKVKLYSVDENSDLELLINLKYY